MSRTTPNPAWRWALLLALLVAAAWAWQAGAFEALTLEA